MTIVRRRTLELAKADLLDRMRNAHVPAHRQMLQRALADIDRQLKELG
jgi:hypothetical protein